MLKRLGAVPVALAIFFSMLNPAYAASARYVHTSGAYAFLTFRDTSATCNVTIDGYAGTTGITADIWLDQLENGRLTTVATWSDVSTGGRAFRFSEVRMVTRGKTYRLTVNATITRNGSEEYITKSVEAICR